MLRLGWFVFWSGLHTAFMLVLCYMLGGIIEEWLWLDRMKPVNRQRIRIAFFVLACGLSNLVIHHLLRVGYMTPWGRLHD